MAHKSIFYSIAILSPVSLDPFLFLSTNTSIIVFLRPFCLFGRYKAVPLQACSGPEGSRNLRFPDYVTMAQDGGKVVSLTHRPPLPLGNAPGTHFW